MGYWVLAIGYERFVIGNWRLVIGYWLLDMGGIAAIRASTLYTLHPTPYVLPLHPTLYTISANAPAFRL